MAQLNYYFLKFTISVYKICNYLKKTENLLNTFTAYILFRTMSQFKYKEFFLFTLKFLQTYGNSMPITLNANNIC